MTGCDICKSYKNQARYYTIRARNRHRTEYYNYRDKENSCNFNRPLSYCLVPNFFHLYISLANGVLACMAASILKKKEKGEFSCVRRACEEEHHSHFWAPRLSFDHLPPQTPPMQATGLSVAYGNRILALL